MKEHAEHLSILERRQHPRFPIRSNEAVVISPRPVISYCLLDMSESGLAFCYHSSKPEKWLNSEQKLDFIGEQFSLEGAPVKIVTDQHLPPDELPAFFRECKIPSLRRCGLQFLDLSPQQQSVIRRYLTGLTTV